MGRASTPPGVTLAAAWTPANVAWVADINPANVAGADGSSVASVASGGTADAFVQATGGNQPLLKTGSNGINSQNVLRFDGSSSTLASTLGGASLTGDWYVAAVVKFTSVTGFQNVLSWGDSGVNGKRRSMLKFNTTNLYEFIGESADVASTTALAAGTAYLLEIQRSGTTITLSVNGASVASGAPTNTLQAYTATALRLGVNPGGSEPLNGDLARAWFLGSVPSAAVLAELRGYVTATYGVAVAGGTAATGAGYLPAYVTVAAVGSTDLYQTGAGKLVLKGTAEINTGGTQLGDTNPAVFSVNGQVAGNVPSAEHQFSNDWAGQNTLAVWNKNAGGFSAVRVRRTDATGVEMGAWGYGRDNEPWGAAGNGSSFWEASDFSNTTLFGVGRIVQTRAGGAGFCASLRMDMQQAGGVVWYRQKVLTGDTLVMTSLAGLTPASTGNNTVQATTIPSPGAGLLVVTDTTNNRLATYAFENTTLNVVYANAIFSVTKDTASKVNVYAESGVIKIQNLSGGTLSLVAAYYGA